METELEELSFKQIAVILKLTYSPGLSLKVCKILMLYYYYFWSHVVLKLLFSCVSYFTEKTEKSFSLITVYTLSIWKSVLKATLLDIKGKQTFLFSKRREVVKVGIK